MLSCSCPYVLQGGCYVPNQVPPSSTSWVAPAALTSYCPHLILGVSSICRSTPLLKKSYSCRITLHLLLSLLPPMPHHSPVILVNPAKIYQGGVNFLLSILLSLYSFVSLSFSHSLNLPGTSCPVLQSILHLVHLSLIRSHLYSRGLTQSPPLTPALGALLTASLAPLYVPPLSLLLCLDPCDHQSINYLWLLQQLHQLRYIFP